MNIVLEPIRNLLMLMPNDPPLLSFSAFLDRTSGVPRAFVTEAFYRQLGVGIYRFGITRIFVVPKPALEKLEGPL